MQSIDAWSYLISVCKSERIIKIGQQLPKLCFNEKGSGFFFDSQCIYQYSRYQCLPTRIVEAEWKSVYPRNVLKYLGIFHRRGFLAARHYVRPPSYVGRIIVCNVLHATQRFELFGNILYLLWTPTLRIKILKKYPKGV